mmetsp:Transcript_23761/g.56668  ORF Transcript_23761/g.56668 Transcript_23761/m.56668 type:complete len:217 (-) Transcript_23761:9-659(-)
MAARPPWPTAWPATAPARGSACATARARPLASDARRRATVGGRAARTPPMVSDRHQWAQPPPMSPSLVSMPCPRRRLWTSPSRAPWCGSASKKQAGSKAWWMRSCRLERRRTTMASRATSSSTTSRTTRRWVPAWIRPSTAPAPTRRQERGLSSRRPPDAQPSSPMQLVVSAAAPLRLWTHMSDLLWVYSWCSVVFCRWPENGQVVVGVTMCMSVP